MTGLRRRWRAFIRRLKSAVTAPSKQSGGDFREAAVPGFVKGSRVWLACLPLIVAAGAALFAWSVAGALGRHGLTQVLAAAGAGGFLLVAWPAESLVLSKLLERPLGEVSDRIAISWLPLFILPISAPYFNGSVASLFLAGGASAKRVAALALWLLALSLAGSVSLKLILFRDHPGTVLRAIERRAGLLVWLLAGGYFAVFTALSWLAFHWFLGYYHSDLAQYNQTLWATLRGHVFYSAGLEETSNSYLGTHVSPFLLVFILPFYALWQSPLMYLMLRVLGLALAAVPLFYLVRRLTASGAAALLLAAAFLFHPEIVSQPFTAGYETVFVAAPFFAAFYYFLENRFGLFLIFLVITVSVREDFIPAAFVFALLALIKRRPRKWALAPLSLGLVWGAAVLIIFKIVVVHNMFNLYYGHLGPTMTAAIGTIFIHPVYVLEEIKKIQTSYLYNLFAPEGLLLPFTGLASLFALPNIAINVLRGSDVSGVAGGISHYSVLIVSAFWVTLAGFIAYLQKKLPGREQVAAVSASLIIAILVAATAHIWIKTLPEGPPADAAALSRALAMVPPDVSFASNDGRALSHVSVRWGLYEPLLWDVPSGPDRLPQGTAWLDADYVLVKPFHNAYYNDAGSFAFLTAPGSRYVKIFDQDGIRLFHKRGK